MVFTVKLIDFYTHPEALKKCLVEKDVLCIKTGKVRGQTNPNKATSATAGLHNNIIMNICFVKNSRLFQQLAIVYNVVVIIS